MDNFDKIIKQKVKQFDVPFNEDHWSEMDGRLNTIRSTKIKLKLLASAAAVALIAAVGYFTTQNNDVPLLADDNTTEIAHNATQEHTQENSNNKTELKANPINQTEETQVDENKITSEELSNNSVIINQESLQAEKTNDETQENQPAEKVIPVAEKMKANAEFIVYNNKVCIGEEVSFEPQEELLPVSYTWNFGDGTISHEKNPTHRYNNSQVYSVSLTLLNRQTGEETTTIQEDVVTILPNPKANFTFSETSVKHDDNKLKYPYTTFTLVDENKECSYKWNYGNGEKSSFSNGKTIYKKTGEFTATLIVKNNITGCNSTHKKKISIKNGFDLFAPTAFTPNNNGGNETFIPKALLGWDTKFEMVILDKFGKTVYTTSDKDEPWNGRINNQGQVLPEGIYLWQVITYDADNKPHQHHGKIHLVK